MNLRFFGFTLAVATILPPMGALASMWGEVNELLPKLFDFDDYKRCFLRNNSVYCTVTIKLQPNKDIKNSSNVWNLIEQISTNKDNYRHDLLRHGICINGSYYNETINNFLTDSYNKKYETLGLRSEITETRCESKNSTYVLGTTDIVFGSCLVIYSVFMISVSLYIEILRTLKGNSVALQASSVQQFFSAFSLFDNWRLLLKISNKNNNDYFMFLQGIRFWIIIGVIITHALEINVVRPVQNPSYTEELPTRFIVMVLANGGMMVQIYFVISSFLLTINFLKKLKNEGHVPFVYIIRSMLGRYIRLTPMYAVIIGLKSTWLVHIARGPFWDPIMGEDHRVCRKNWWKNLLYFNNFFMDDGLCMFQSWYLSVDLQFYILGLFILWASQKKPKRLFFILIILMACHMGLTSYNLFENNWEMAVKLRPELLYYFRIIYWKEWQATWTTTYSHLPALVSGLCFGYYYWKNKTEKVFSKKKHEILWWILSWSMFVGPVLFTSYYMTTSYYSHTKWFTTIYGSFCKTIYSFGVGAVIFGMAFGLGGYVKKGLEWIPMHLLGQLTFGVYLIHFTILKIDAAMSETPLYVSDRIMLNGVVTNSVISYIFAAILTLCIQMPVVRISKKFL